MIRRIMGTLLMVIGMLGIALSALGVVNVWRAAENVTVAADEGFLLLSDTLEDVDRSLDVASTTLDGVTIAIDSLYVTSFDIGRTLSSTQVTMDEMASLAEGDLPQSIESSLALALIGGAHALTANIHLRHRRDRFVAIGRPSDEHLVNQFFPQVRKERAGAERAPLTG